MPYTIKHFSVSGTEDEIIGMIDHAKRSRAHAGELHKLLDHAHGIYTGRSLNEARRIRGYLLESFAHTGLSQRALPYILDELTFSIDAYTVAAAAIALRGLPKPYPQLSDYLFLALTRIRNVNDAVSFERYKPSWPLQAYTTPVLEIVKTFQWMGSAAAHDLQKLEALTGDLHFNEQVKTEIRRTITIIENAPAVAAENCCTAIPAGVRAPYRKHKHDLSKIVLQDQAGRTMPYTSFFTGKPTLLVFFYTRCENPNRCSLTVTRLGYLQRALQQENLQDDIQLAAITYDPLYDSSQRMSAYCSNRGFQLNDHHRCFSAVEGMNILLQHVSPAVNYNETIINHHGTELFLITAGGTIKKRIPGIEWNEAMIIAECRRLLHQPTNAKENIKNRMSSFMSVLFSAVVLFFPKCPFCIAAWLSLLGISNIQFFAIRGWLLPLMALLLACNVVALYIMGRRRKNFLPFYISALGVCTIITAALLPNRQAIGYAGMGMMLIASILNSFPFMPIVKQTLNFKINGGTKNRKQVA